MESLSDDEEPNANDIREHNISLTKWIPDEWGYSDGKHSELVEISKLLFAKEESNSKEYGKHKDLFFETITTVLKHLIESNIFEKNTEEITYFVSMSDDERTPKIEDYSAKILNSENVYKRSHEEILSETEFLKNYCDNLD